VFTKLVLRILLTGSSRLNTDLREVEELEVSRWGSITKLIEALAIRPMNEI
jgi:hypothetical protein